MKNKFGKYIGDLMLLVVENREKKEQAVYKLAVQELKKLADDIYAFVKTQTEEKEKPSKQLLQEKSNGHR